MTSIEQKYQESLEREKNYNRAKTVSWLMGQFERLEALGFKLNVNTAFRDTLSVQKVACYWEEELNGVIIDYGFSELKNAFSEYINTHDYGFPTIKQILDYFNGKPSPKTIYRKYLHEKELDTKELKKTEDIREQFESDKQILLSLPINKRFDWLKTHYPGHEAEFSEEMGVSIGGNE